MTNPTEYYQSLGYKVFERDSEEHRNSFGGHDLTRILGLNKWPGGTDLDLYMERKGMVEPEQTERMAMGLWFERPIFDYYAENLCNSRTDTILPNNFAMAVYNPDLSYINPEFSNMLRANPDGFVYCRKNHRCVGLIQVKNISEYSQGDWYENKEPRIPQMYAIQSQLYMRVLNMDYTDFAVCFGGNRIRLFRLDRDHSQDRDDFWRDYVALFKEQLDTDSPPGNQTDHPHYGTAYNKYHRIAGPEIIQDNTVLQTDQFDTDAKDYYYKKVIEKKAIEKQNAIKNKLLDYMIRENIFRIEFDKTPYKYAKLARSSADNWYVKFVK